MEHATAIISDAFWFVICAVINPDKYPDHVEWFQERMATNYISFTLNDVFLESNPGKMSNQELSKKERDLLQLFLTSNGRVLSRERILNTVWGLNADPLTNVVDVYVGRLRRKLDQEGQRILTLRNVGYRMT